MPSKWIAKPNQRGKRFKRGRECGVNIFINIGECGKGISPNAPCVLREAHLWRSHLERISTERRTQSFCLKQFKPGVALSVYRSTRCVSNQTTISVTSHLTQRRNTYKGRRIRQDGNFVVIPIRQRWVSCALRPLPENGSTRTG